MVNCAKFVFNSNFINKNLCKFYTSSSINDYQKWTFASCTFYNLLLKCLNFVSVGNLFRMGLSIFNIVDHNHSQSSVSDSEEIKWAEGLNQEQGDYNRHINISLIFKGESQKILWFQQFHADCELSDQNIKVKVKNIISSSIFFFILRKIVLVVPVVY